MSVGPVGAYAFDTTLRVQVRRTVGYRASCVCGQRSRVRRTVREARQELVERHAEAGSG